jgi:hypothetical protein
MAARFNFVLPTPLGGAVKATVQGGGPVGRQMPINPIAAYFQAVVARLQIEQQGDTPALAVEFAMLVGRYRYEADDAGVEAQGTVGIVLEYVGDPRIRR